MLDSIQRKILEKHLEMKKRDAWCLYAEYVKWLKSVLEELNINLQVAEEEADTVLAKGKYDIIVSSDSDLLILGCKCLWIPRGIGIQHNQILQEDFLSLTGLQGEQVYQLAFLAGCDVQPRKIVDIQTAISMLRFYGSIEKIQERMPRIINTADLEEYRNLRNGSWFLEKSAAKAQRSSK
jgi:5'-3' exonuclease